MIRTGGASLVMPGEGEVALLELQRRAELFRRARYGQYRRGGFRRSLNPIDGAVMEFCAEIFPDEGLDIVLGQWPKDTTRLSTTYLCLFTSQTASTVITSGQTMTNVTEATFTNYARQALAAATWGAQAAGTGGRKSTYSQVTYAAAGSAQVINGFFIGDATPPVKVVGQANFDDGAATSLQSGDVIKVTPTAQFNN